MAMPVSASGSRHHRRAWAAGLPSDARVAHESYAAIRLWSTAQTTHPSPLLFDKRFDRQVMFAPELHRGGTLSRQGITHVVVCELAYGRYFIPQVIPADDHRDVYEHRRWWYGKLFEEYECVWSNEPAIPTLALTNPTIRAYDVRRKKTVPADAGRPMIADAPSPPELAVSDAPAGHP